jgi:type I restriction enzyme R subunit
MEPSLPPDDGTRRARPRDGTFIVVSGEVLYELGPDGHTLRQVPYFEYAREAIGELCPAPEDLVRRWLKREWREELSGLLNDAGVDLPELAAAMNLEDRDPLDVLRHALFKHDVPTRTQRVDRLKAAHGPWLEQFAAPAREVLDVLLEKYLAGEADDLGDPELLRVPPLSERGTFVELAARLGGGAALRQALAELKQHLYED